MRRRQSKPRLPGRFQLRRQNDTTPLGTKRVPEPFPFGLHSTRRKSQPFASHNPAMRVVRNSNAANATKESAQPGFSHGLQDFMHHRSVIVR